MGLVSLEVLFMMKEDEPAHLGSWRSVRCPPECVKDNVPGPISWDSLPEDDNRVIDIREAEVSSRRSGKR